MAKDTLSFSTDFTIINLTDAYNIFDKLVNLLYKEMELTSRNIEKIKEKNFKNTIKYIFTDKEEVLSRLNLRIQAYRDIIEHSTTIKTLLYLLKKNYRNYYENIIEEYTKTLLIIMNKLLDGIDNANKTLYLIKYETNIGLLKHHYDSFKDHLELEIKMAVNEKRRVEEEKRAKQHFYKYKSKFSLEVKQAFLDLGIKSGSEVSASIIKKQYREMAKIHHPDKGGSETKMQQINKAYDIAKAYFDNK